MRASETHIREALDELRRLRARNERLRKAAQALFDAPHQEHFITRLNDEEMTALDALRAALSEEGK